MSRVMSLDEADLTPCENVFEGVWHRTKGTPWIFTQPLMKINLCWKDVECSSDDEAQSPRFHGPHILPAALSPLHTVSSCPLSLEIGIVEGRPPLPALQPPPDNELPPPLSSSALVLWPYSKLGG